MNKTLWSLLPLALVAGCASSPADGPRAEATLMPTTGSTAQGVVSFTQRGDRVMVHAEVSGLAPGAHGFHIHEKGDCSAPDAMSAGGHFNPTGQPHGDPQAGGAHHLGDMPALMADAAGKASLDAELRDITVGAGSGDVVGRSVIVHTARDDYATQPTGNSGARLACGVIAM